MKRKYFIVIGILILVVAAWIVMKAFRKENSSEKKTVEEQADWMKQIKPQRKSFN